ncbi:MAG: transcriptional repressor [Chloroflexi bacterium]|nr:transcriptional repressor [Chloroflexota bacterium]
MVRKTAHSANVSRAGWMLQRLAEEGLRHTEQRAIVVQAIVDKRGAFTAEGLVDELQPRGVARATVYRTVEVLERVGLLARIHLDNRHGYTVCEEGHHHHLLCERCGVVIPVDASDVEVAIRRLADALRFQVDTHLLEFAGLCEACQARNGRTGSAP